MIYRKSPREQLVTSLILPDEPIKEQKSINKLSNSDKKIPQSPKKTVDYTPISPDFNNEQILLRQRNKAYKLTNFTQKQMIQNYQSSIQEKIRDLEAGQDQSKVLKNIFKNSVSPNQYIELGIEDVANNAIEKVAGGINQKTKLKRQVPQTKDDLKELQKVDKYRFLKIKNGQIKNKVGDLRNSLQKQYYERKANFKLPDYQNIKQSDYYSIDNPKTKQANEFIQKVKKKREEEKMKYFQFLLKKSEQQKMKRSMEHQKKLLIAQQRKQRLQQQFHEKQLMKQKQLEQNLRKKEEFKEWSKVYQKQKPLYMRKQEQFIQKQLIPELEQKFNKIHEIKMQNLKRSQQLYQIGSHDQYYMEFKRDDRVRNEAQKEYQREKIKENQKQIESLFKGKYRYIALEEMMNQKYKNQQNPRELQKYKKARQLEYGDEIKEKALQQFKIKQMQTLGLEKKVFSKRTRNIDGSAVSMDGNDESKMTSYTDPKSHGKKNLHYLHELIKQKGVRKDRPYIKLIEQKNIYPDYLQQIRQKRKNNQDGLGLSGVRNEGKEKQSPIEEMLAKQKRMRDEIKRDEVRRRHNSLDYKQDANIQDKELNAVKLKMKLISQLS